MRGRSASASVNADQIQHHTGSNRALHDEWGATTPLCHGAAMTYALARIRDEYLADTGYLLPYTGISWGRVHAYALVKGSDHKLVAE